MAAAKHRPKYLRLRSSQRLNAPGNSLWMAEAANATYSQGTAQRTDSWIMSETPGPVVRSLTVMATAMTTEIGPETSQNSPHLFTARALRMLFRSVPMRFGPHRASGCRRF